MQSKPRPKQTRVNDEGDPSISFFIFVILSVVILAIGSLVVLQSDQWVYAQRFWLISRASAITAYLILTVLIISGTVLSHPRNKDTWKLTRYLLSWHQALVAIMFTLIAIHLFFTATDSKSGITWQQMVMPIHSKYHPIAMILGSLGFYALLLIGASAGLRKWTRSWLPIHRISVAAWVLVTLHGLFGGTDSTQLHSLYLLSSAVVYIGFFWRHWSLRQKKAKANKSSSTSIPN